ASPLKQQRIRQKVEKL
nr:Chain A5, C-TERM HELIX PDF [Escherichia coli]